MTYPALISQRNNCRNCYKCIRFCPVKSIRFSGNQASIMEDECILCGKCYNICPQGAKTIRNDLERLKVMLVEHQTVIASIAPSFVAYYPQATMPMMARALKRIGFSHVEETAVGAAMVAKRYERMLTERDQKVLISSSCPSVNMLIQKYYPQALPFLAGVVTPMHAHALALRKQYPNAKVVFFGPCIAKKAEADNLSDTVDLALTFDELDAYLKTEQISLFQEEIPEQAGRARFFPTTGGIIKTMNHNPDYTYLAVDGIENCIHAIQDIANGNLTGCFIEMSACNGSCVGGPLMQRAGKSPIKGYMAVTGSAAQANDPEPSDLPGLELGHAYLGKSNKKASDKEIQDILKQMGKNSPEDELNCGSCGYSTCREKALAVHQGKANYAMCLPFLKEKAESFSDNIISNTLNSIFVLNESLEVQQINKAALNMMNIAHESHVLGESVVRILDPLPFLDVLEKKKDIHESHTYLAEYGKYVEQTILYDHSYHILICIMRDVTEEALLRKKREEISRKTIETADQVVEKQMRIVQEIASLLGETTAETKIALTKLKESFTDE